MAIKDLIISSLRGGMNEDTPNALADDQCVLAENVEFFQSMVGERRNGCAALDITDSNLDDESIGVHISQWYPDNDVLNPEIFAVSATPGTSVTVSARTDGTWAELTPTDAFTNTSPDIYGIVTQSLNGKLFVAGRTAQDRVHLRGGLTDAVLRRAGLAEPAAPTAADTGSGSYATTRYFRVRYIIKSGTTIVARSEPSDALTFTPAGTGTGALITKPSTISEGETHWELEASTDNATFYRIATTVVGTTTVTDSTAFATGYADAGTLSEDIGEYTLLPSAKFLTVDGDRLIGAGHWTDTTKQSQIWWTPVFNDPGVGNDERLPASVNNTVNLDNYDGGPITGICSGGSGTWYAFKWAGVYKMVRTGDVNRAYDVVTISKVRGAIPGSIVRGVDENGASCVYFLDPQLGPSRVGIGGIQRIVGLRKTWKRVNLQASAVIARSVYYASKQQVHWWVSVDGQDRPTLKLVLQTTETRSVGANAVGGGWSLATGTIAAAACAAMLTEIVSIDGTVSLSERPFIGLADPDFFQRCDVESTDAGDSYTATIRTKPYIVTGLLTQWGALTASILATASEGQLVRIKLIKDYGLDENDATADLSPEDDEEYVIKNLDDLFMSEATTIQVEITDL